MRRKINQSTSSFRTTDFLKDQISHFASETDKSDSTFIRDACLIEIKRLKNEQNEHRSDLRWSS
jgi:predicted transcriptional regulator